MALTLWDKPTQWNLLINDAFRTSRFVLCKRGCTLSKSVHTRILLACPLLGGLSSFKCPS